MCGSRLEVLGPVVLSRPLPTLLHSPHLALPPAAVPADPARILATPMSNHPQLGFDHLLVELGPQLMVPPSAHPGQPAPDWIPPPALLTTVNSDAIDLNDEIFFNYNPVPSHQPYADSYVATNDAEALLLTLLLATLPYNALQLAITTPDMTLASPQKFDPNIHYSHRRRFLLAVEQLNRMSLHPHMLKLPSPDPYPGVGAVPAKLEERTINPRQLLGNISGGAAAAVSAGQNTVPASSRYILPSSVLSPSLLTFFSRAGDMLDVDFSGADAGASIPHLLDVAGMPPLPLSSSNDDGVNGQNSYVMNDECVSAITYWLNNTENLISENTDDVVMKNPTGILKPKWKRRNSIQVIPNRTEMSPQRPHPVQKRKRRKSVNTSIPEDTAAPPQVYKSSQLPGMSFASQFQTMTLLGMNNGDIYQNDELSLRLDVHHDGGSGSTESLHQDTSRYAPPELSNSQLVDSRLSGGPVADGDDESKPFPCPECDKQFKRLEHLKRHIRSVHLNIRPFHCKYCDKKFLRSDNLAQHSKTHFKVNANGTTTIIYGNPNPHNRGARKKSVSSDASGMAHSSQ